MQDGCDLRAAPDLIDPGIEDNVRHQEARILPGAAGRCGTGSTIEIRERGGAVSDLHDRMLELCRILHRNRGRDAVTPLLGIAVSVDADAGVILVEEVRLI